jgi:hypothetical protein
MLIIYFTKELNRKEVNYDHKKKYNIQFAAIPMKLSLVEYTIGKLDTFLIKKIK